MHFRTVLVLLLFVFIQVTYSQYEYGRPNWSVCEGEVGQDRCFNGYARDDGRFNLNVTSVSVTGMWIFFASGRDANEPTGLAEFVFQERFGDYKMLTETRGNISSLKGIGAAGNYTTSGVTVFNKIQLVTDGASNLHSSTGSFDDCWRYGSASLVLSGNEPWELFRPDGTSVCIVVANRNSFVPGIVRDVNQLGLQHNEICVFSPGCSSNIWYTIDNSATHGVLRR